MDVNETYPPRGALVHITATEPQHARDAGAAQVNVQDAHLQAACRGGRGGDSDDGEAGLMIT